MKSEIETWLRQEGKFKSFEKHQGFNWVITAIPAKGQPVSLRIVNPSPSPGQILIIIGQRISKEIQNFIQNIEKARKKEILLDLRLEMNRRPVEFKMNHPDGILNEVQIQYVIYEDGLTKNEFFKGMREVYKSFLQLQWLLQKHLGKEAKKKPFGTKIIPFQNDFT